MLNTMSKTELAYIAGLIDGEGTIGIFNHKNRGKFLSISVSQKDTFILEWLKKTIGVGNVVIPKAFHFAFGKDYKITPHFKITYSKNGIPLLKLLIPYLLIKKEKAIKCLKELL